MSDELKPCPFCGGEAAFDFDYGGVVCVVCGGCGIASPNEESKARAAKFWNRRASMTKDELALRQRDEQSAVPQVRRPAWLPSPEDFALNVDAYVGQNGEIKPTRQLTYRSVEKPDLRARLVACLEAIVVQDDVTELDDPHYCLGNRAEIDALLKELRAS